MSELDERGEVVYFVPYRVQLDLTEFQLGPLLSLPTRSNNRLPRVVFHRKFVERSGGPEFLLSIVVPLRRPTVQSFLVVTFGKRSGAEPDRLSYALLNSQSEPVMEGGNKTRILIGNALAGDPRSVDTRRSTVLIDGLPYALIVPAFQSNRRPGLQRALLAFGALIIVFTFAFNWLSHYLLHWVVKEQWKRAHMQQDVDSVAKGIAHDFRNNLSALDQLRASLSDSMNADQKRRFEGVHTFLAAHTEQIRPKLANAFALPGVPGGITYPLTQGVETYLRGTLDNIAKGQAAILGKNIPIFFDTRFESNEPFVGMSSTDLERILTNLISNSIDACRQNGTNGVRMRVYPSREFIHVQVIDDGIGIPLEAQGRIFESGFGTKGSGRGHGLATCLELAHASGATLTLVESHPSQGTTMELQFRARPAPAWFIDEIELTGGAVIVVVDDEPHIGEFWEDRIRERLDGINMSVDMQPELVRITHPSQLRSNYKTALDRGSLFLIDYKFDNDQTTRIQLIEELHLEAKAVLVTNLFDDPEVVSAVGRLGIRLMPKKYRFSLKFPIQIGADDESGTNR
jgi:signal transduction histidine kinase